MNHSIHFTIVRRADELVVAMPDGYALDILELLAIARTATWRSAPLMVDIGDLWCDASSLADMLVGLAARPRPGHLVFHGDERTLDSLTDLFEREFDRPPQAYESRRIGP